MTFGSYTYTTPHLHGTTLTRHHTYTTPHLHDTTLTRHHSRHTHLHIYIPLHYLANITCIRSSADLPSWVDLSYPSFPLPPEPFTLSPPGQQGPFMWTIPAGDKALLKNNNNNIIYELYINKKCVVVVISFFANQGCTYLMTLTVHT